MRCCLTVAKQVESEIKLPIDDAGLCKFYY